MANLTLYQDILLKKVATRDEYVGYYLLKFLIFERKSEEELLSYLECSEEDFIKLALCRINPPLDIQFANSINKISNYVTINELALSQLIKKVAIKDRQQNKVNKQSFLLAAREKTDHLKNQDEKNSK